MRPDSGSRRWTLDSRPARGFTLVELLVTILIISILGALVLGVAAVAGETAREARSRTMITRLHTLLIQHMETYKSRRVILHPGVEIAIANSNALNNSGKKGRALAEARLYALREMMLMEIPDRWSDVLLAAVPNAPTPGDPQLTNPVKPLYLSDRPDLANVYLRRYQQLVGRTNTITGANNTGEQIKRNQGAECLYLIITLATGDGEARALFSENNIGDADGDGAKEFLDGWGHPVNFLRWAPGFDSEIQANANELGPPPTNVTSAGAPNLWLSTANSDHDPYDIFRVDNRAFRLVPLIYSPGRDEDSGLNVATDFVTWPTTTGSTVPDLQTVAPHIRGPLLTPYVKAPPPILYPDNYFGTAISFIDPDEENTATDNVHNHLIGER